MLDETCFKSMLKIKMKNVSKITLTIQICKAVAVGGKVIKTFKI